MSVMTAGRQAISATKHWCTPPHLAEAARKALGGIIGLDPCSNPDSTVPATRKYMLPTHDGLIEPWDAHTIYVNPPYGIDKTRGSRILDWFTRAHEAADAGSHVVMLVPVAPNTSHWKRHVFPVATSICFLYATRLRFHINGTEDPQGAPMACAAIYYGPSPQLFADNFRPYGAVVRLDTVALPPIVLPAGVPGS